MKKIDRYNIDRSNKPDTCLYCGTKLYIDHNRRYEKTGAYGDGFFCTQVCGFWFGRAMARNGKRLAPFKSKGGD